MVFDHKNCNFDSPLGCPAARSLFVRRSSQKTFVSAGQPAWASTFLGNLRTIKIVSLVLVVIFEHYYFFIRLFARIRDESFMILTGLDSVFQTAQRQISLSRLAY